MTASTIPPLSVWPCGTPFGNTQESEFIGTQFRSLYTAVDSPPKLCDDDDPFIVLTETKFSIRYIPVWVRVRM
jgi:hypothetical protein